MEKLFILVYNTQAGFGEVSRRKRRGDGVRGDVWYGFRADMSTSSSYTRRCLLTLTPNFLTPCEQPAKDFFGSMLKDTWIDGEVGNREFGRRKNIVVRGIFD